MSTDLVCMLKLITYENSQNTYELDEKFLENDKFEFMCNPQNSFTSSVCRDDEKSATVLFSAVERFLSWSKIPAINFPNVIVFLS